MRDVRDEVALHRLQALQRGHVRQHEDRGARAERFRVGARAGGLQPDVGQRRAVEEQRGAGVAFAADATDQFDEVRAADERHHRAADVFLGETEERRRRRVRET